MKITQILVGFNGAHVQMSSGAKMIAAMPPARGDKEFFGLFEDGKMRSIKGTRLAGVGVPRYLKENGFIEAPDGDQRAAKLADMLDQRQAIKMVESLGQEKAHQIRKTFGGQVLKFIPFDPAKEILDVEIAAPNGFVTSVLEFGTHLSEPQVETKFGPHGSGVSLARGWLIESSKDQAAYPRNEEYGGLVERAVYALSSCGIGELVGAQNLLPNDESESYARGRLDLMLPTGDFLTVGVDGADELHARYYRNNACLHERRGLEGLSIGQAIGSIAAVLIRVQEVDAFVAPKKPRKKAA